MVYKSECGSNLIDKGNGFYYDEYTGDYYIIGSDDEPKLLVSSETGAPLKIMPDGRLYSEHEGEYYKIDNNKQIVSAEYKSECGSNLIDKGNGFYYDEYTGDYYIIGSDDEPKLLVSSETGAPLKIMSDGRLYSEHEGQYYEFNYNFNRVIPTFIPDVTLEKAFVDGNYLVGKETGRKFPITKARGVILPSTLRFPSITLEQAKNYQQIDIDIDIARDSIPSEKMIESALNYIEELSKVGDPSISKKMIESSSFADYDKMTLEEVNKLYHFFNNYLDVYKILYLKTVEQHSATAEEEKLFNEIRQYIYSYDYSLTEIKQQYNKYAEVIEKYKLNLSDSQEISPKKI